LVWIFSIALGLLIYWLLGFIVNDIATWPGPDYQNLETNMLDAQRVQELKKVDTDLTDVNQQIGQRKNRQSLLRDSTESSKQTMNQLLEVHRLSLEKNVEPTQTEQEALAEAEQLFLDNQKQYQQLNTEIVLLEEQLSTLGQRQESLNEQLETARVPIRQEYQRLRQWHDLMLAAIKLAVLLPLSLIAGWLFLKWRHRTYAPLTFALGIALAVEVTLVMHEHFPARYFKYILVVAALAVVTQILIYLLRMMAHPGRDYLLNQYREAYERFLCPVCGYPIRRGPLKYVFWSRRTIKKLHFPPPMPSQPEEPYTCPACGTRLFEECASCKKVRYSLLPVCTECGHEKPTDEVISRSTSAADSGQ
jgi:predicted RNA-binding Zn-ribbon protein involved in translation (DUF1610 family)